MSEQQERPATPDSDTEPRDVEQTDVEQTDVEQTDVEHKGAEHKDDEQDAEHKDDEQDAEHKDDEHKDVEQRAGEDKAGEDTAADPEPAVEPAGFRLRRAPRYRPFGLTGAVFGVVAGAVLALSFTATSDYSIRTITGYFAAIFGLIGAVLGLGLAVLLERRRRS